MAKGYQLGLVKKQTFLEFKLREQKIAAELAALKNQRIQPTKEVSAMLNTINEKLNQPTTFFNLLKRTTIDFRFLVNLGYCPVNPYLTQLETEKIEIETRYQDYILKVKEQLAQAEKNENKKLPLKIDYLQIKGLSNEAREKLHKITPATLGQASRIAGVSPADISVLLVWLEMRRRKAISPLPRKSGERAGDRGHKKKGVSRGTIKK